MAWSPSDGLDAHPIMGMRIRVYKALNEGRGSEFLALIEGSYVGPFGGESGVAARRKADDWRRAEVEKEIARQKAIEARVEGGKRARARKAETVGEEAAE